MRCGSVRGRPAPSPVPPVTARAAAEPTVTDANLLLGYLDPRAGLAGGVELDRDAAAATVGELADSLGIGLIEAATGIHEVANQEMIRALRVITVERGVDPRRFDLLPFGGAGPLHAVAIAAELGIDRVICPHSGGVLSALGLVCAERRRDTTRTVMLSGERLSGAGIAAAVEATLEGLERDEGTTLEAIYELRYRGQSFELPIEAQLEPEPGELIEAFAAEHERRYGYRGDAGAVELVNVRLAAREPLTDFELPAGGSEEPLRSVRPATFGGEPEPVEVIAGEPPVGLAVTGPCVFELPETTFLVPGGWRAEVDGYGSIVARRAGERR